MEKKNIRIDHIRVADLPDFTRQVISDSSTGQFVPITLQRALAHANNPVANEDDIGLLVAVDGDGDVVGYFGILPILLRVGEESHKVHWFTTWSVSSKVRGMGVGSMLMEEAISLNLDFLIVGSIHARRVCQKYGFWEREPLTYFWIDLSGMGMLNPIKILLRLSRKILHILKIDKNILVTTPITKRLDRLISPATKKINLFILERAYRRILNNIQYKEVSEVKDYKSNKVDLPRIELHRGGEIINWMLKFPWVVEEGKSPTERMDYFFSDARPLFQFIPLNIFENKSGKYLGFVVFSISQKPGSISVKTLDFRIDGPGSDEFILALAVNYARKFNADIIEIPGDIAAAFNPFVLWRFLLQRKERIYQCLPSSEDSPLAQAWSDIDFHLYDGDMSFS